MIDDARLGASVSLRGACRLPVPNPQVVTLLVCSAKDSSISYDDTQSLWSRESSTSKLLRKRVRGGGRHTEGGSQPSR